jgi:hypothetical protein
LVENCGRFINVLGIPSHNFLLVLENIASANFFQLFLNASIQLIPSSLFCILSLTSWKVFSGSVASLVFISATAISLRGAIRYVETVMMGDNIASGRIQKVT